MITENKEKKVTEKGLMSPEKANEPMKKPSKKALTNLKSTTNIHS